MSQRTSDAARGTSDSVRVIAADEVLSLAQMPLLVSRLEEAFRGVYACPERQITTVPGGEGRIFAAMPAFDAQGCASVKLASFFPDNAARGKPTIQAAIILFDASGSPIAWVDGTTITRLRTGAASALASKYLSRENSSHLVTIGTGALAPYMALGHCAVRPIRRISVCGRRIDRAHATADAIRALVRRDVEVSAADSAEDAVSTADIVSCATSSPTPVLAGKWLRVGTLVDLVGSFSPAKRETDDAALLRSRIFVDTFEGVLSEAGDIVEPLARGVIDRSRIEGELADLVSGRVTGRAGDDEITLFKSVGTAREDFAAAQMIVQLALDQHKTEAIEKSSRLCG